LNVIAVKLYIYIPNFKPTYSDFEADAITNALRALAAFNSTKTC